MIRARPSWSIGAQRVDLFVAEQDDSDNVFREAG